MKHLTKMLVLLCAVTLMMGICTAAMADIEEIRYGNEFSLITVYHPVGDSGGIPVASEFPAGSGVEVKWYWDNDPAGQNPFCEEDFLSDSKILSSIPEEYNGNYWGHYVYPKYTIDGKTYSHGHERWVLFPASAKLPQCIARHNDSQEVQKVTFASNGSAKLGANLDGRGQSNDPSKTLVYQWDVHILSDWNDFENEQYVASYQTTEGTLNLPNTNPELVGKKLRIRCSLGYQEDPGLFTEGGSFLPLNVFIPVVMSEPVSESVVVGSAEELQEIPKVETTANVTNQEDFVELMADLTVENTRASGSDDYRIEVKDVVPKKWNGTEWQEIRDVSEFPNSEFPREGVRVLLPWPDGEGYVTMQGKAVYVAHMFTKACNGYDAGYVEYLEYPAVNVQPEGIYVTLMGMSPVSIYWEDAAAADPISYAAASTPKTGDSSHLMLWASLMIVAACGMVVISRKRLSAER